MQSTSIKESELVKKKSTNNKFGEGVEKNKIHAYCWWECKLVQPLRETVWRFLKKLKTELPYDPEISIPGIYLKKKKN